MPFQNNVVAGSSGASAAGGGVSDFYSHEISNSVRFNSSASAHMYHTQGTPTNVDKCTISLWVKRSKLGSDMWHFTGSGKSGGGYSFMGFGGDGDDPDLFYFLQDPGSPNLRLESTARFRDPSAWYHVVIAQDSTQGTAANRNKIYINGVQITAWGDYETYSTQNSDFLMNTSGHKIFVGSGGDSGGGVHLPFDGYIAEYVFIDGTQYAATDFGEHHNGVWRPKDPSGLTFGNNGCYLKFESSGDLGNDSSGNNNDFTLSNVSAHDQMKDSPAFGASSTGNCCTLNPLTKQSGLTISEGNLKMSRSSAGNVAIPATMGASKGKYYFEVYWNNDTQVGNYAWGFVEPDSSLFGGTAIAIPDTYNLRVNSGNAYINGAGVITMNSTTPTTGTIIGIAIDFDNGKIFYGQDGGSSSRSMNWNNSNTGTGVPESGTNPAQTFTAGSITLVPAFSISSIGDTNWILNFGQSSAFSGALTSQGNTDDNGQGDYYYAPPTGFTGWTTGGLKVADEIDPDQTDYDFPQGLFQALTYTGTGSSGSIATAFQPDLIWAKNRGTTKSHYVVDSTRGINSTSPYLHPDSNASEGTGNSTGVSGVSSSSISLGGGLDYLNANSNTYIFYLFRANKGVTTTNSTGTVNATQQVDPSGGFSISTYAGTGSSMTVGHGLTAGEPKFTIIKDRGNSVNWVVYTKVVDGSLDYFELSTTAAKGDSGFTGPNSSIWNFDGSSSYSNTSGRNYVMYNWTNVEGYIKVGTYTGNSDNDGTFCFVGFKPALLLIREVAADNWLLYNNKTLGYNNDSAGNAQVYPDTNVGEQNQASRAIDLYANGFKLRTSNATGNASNTYIFLAIAHNSLKYATAR